MSGKILIQRRPALPIERESTFLAASICCERIRAGVKALRPKEPKATVAPREATPTLLGFLLMVCHFLYLTFFGNNMLLKNFAFVYPNLHSHRAERQVGCGGGVIDIGAQGLERYSAFFEHLFSRHTGGNHPPHRNLHPLHFSIGYDLLKRLFNHSSI